MSARRWRDHGTPRPDGRTSAHPAAGPRPVTAPALNEPPLLHRQAENSDISIFHHFHRWFLSPRVCGSMGGRVQLRVLTLPPSPAEREGRLVRAARGSPICETPGLHSGFSCRFSQTQQHNPSRPGPAPQQTHPKGQHQGRRAPAARTTTTPEGKNPLCWKIVGGEAGRGRSLHQWCHGLASRAGRSGGWVLVVPGGLFRGGCWGGGQVGEHWAGLAQLGTSLSGSEGALFQKIKG